MWGRFGDRNSDFDIVSRQFAGFEYYVTDATDPDAEAALYLQYGQKWDVSETGTFARVLTRIKVDADGAVGHHFVTAIYTIPKFNTQNLGTLGYLYPAWVNWPDAPLVDLDGKKIDQPVKGVDDTYTRWHIISGSSTRQNILQAWFFTIEIGADDAAANPLMTQDYIAPLTHATARAAIAAIVGKVNSDNVSSKIPNGTAGRVLCRPKETQELPYGRSRIRLLFIIAPFGTTWANMVTVQQQKRTKDTEAGGVLWVPITGVATEARRYYDNTAPFATVAGWIR
jgi:hypothetical protein